MLLMYYDIKVKSLCAWGSQNFFFGQIRPPIFNTSKVKRKKKNIWKKKFFLENFFF